MTFLSIDWQVDPVLFQFGFLQIRWYSLLFVSGFILGWYIFSYFFRREGIKQDLLDPLLYTLLIATVIGARLGHCLFYQPEYYLGSLSGFLEIFMPWKGGLASHGGTIALLVAMWIFVKKYGKANGFDYVWLLDHLAVAVAFAATFIRLGNLFNSEIYGHVTDLPWAFVFTLRGETLAKHPTQLYEALSYLILALSLFSLYRFKLEKLYRGTLIGIFFIGCFGMRFLIEFVKENQVDFEQNMSLNMGQLLSLPFICIGVYFLYYAYSKRISAKSLRQ